MNPATDLVGLMRLAACLRHPVARGWLPLPIAEAVLTMAICRTSISAADLVDAEHVLHDLLWTEAVQ